MSEAKKMIGEAMRVSGEEEGRKSLRSFSALFGVFATPSLMHACAPHLKTASTQAR